MNRARVRREKVLMTHCACLVKWKQYIWFPYVAVTRTFRNKPLFRVKTPFGANHDILIELFTRTLPFNGTSDLLLEVNGKT